MTQARAGNRATEQTVLFVCVENACRSLMAEAIFNAKAPTGWRAISAGTRPASAPNARTAPMLDEIGLRLPRHPPQLLTPDLLHSARICVTMGCLDDASCPSFLRTVEVRDWNLSNPSNLDDSGFRGVRDRLVALIEALLRESPIGPTA
ncbi:MAG: low molecular weight phosphatase family protein [Thermoplasmata archaeon]